MSNEQEQFWRGQFGDEYHKRNTGRVNNNANFFFEIFSGVLANGNMPHSIIEFGAGIGENLLAIHEIWSEAILIGVDINAEAVGEMEKQRCIEHAFLCPIGDYRGGLRATMTMTKGCLIHIPPADLPAAYATLYRETERWILICEYYNPTPVEVEYRGHQGKLWKRDFAGEIMDTYKDLRLVDYGWRYHRDEYPQDDLHWFLLSKGD